MTNITPKVSLRQFQFFMEMAVRRIPNKLICALMSPVVAACVTVKSGEKSDLTLHSNRHLPLSMLQKSIISNKKPEEKPRFHFRVINLPAVHLLEAIHQEHGLGYDADECAEAPVTVIGTDIPLDRLLEILATQTESDYVISDNHISLRCDVEELRIYAVNQLAISRVSTDTSQIHGGITPKGSAQGGADNQAAAKLTISNEVSHDAWALLETQIDMLIQSGTRIEEKHQQKIKMADKDRSSTNSRGKTTQSQQTSEERSNSVTRIKTLSGRVVVNREAASIAVFATPSEHERVKTWLDTLQNAWGRQVMIEATLAEVTLNENHQRGIDWQLFLDSAIRAGITTSPNPAANAVQFTLSAGEGRLQGNLTLQLLDQFGRTHVVAKPRLMAMNQQTALLKVVDNRVYFTTDVQTTAPSNNSAAFSTFETKVHTIPVGFLMAITPHISENGQVQLHLKPSLSRIVGFVADPNPALALTNTESKIPEIQTRELESVVTMSSGETIVMGGLKQMGDIQTIDGIAGDQSIFATRQSKSRQDTELVLILKAVSLSANTKSGLEHTPDSSDEAHAWLTKALAYVGESEPIALSLLKEASSRFPYEPTFAFNSALLLARMRQWDEANQSLRMAKDACTDNTCAIHAASLAAAISEASRYAYQSK